MALFNRPSLLRRLVNLPIEISERIGLLDHVPPGLAEGQRAPRHVFRWDLDKTYLRTEFDSLADLAKSAFETAADKQAYPGATRRIKGFGDDHDIASRLPQILTSVAKTRLPLAKAAGRIRERSPKTTNDPGNGPGTEINAPDRMATIAGFAAERSGTITMKPWDGGVHATAVKTTTATAPCAIDNAPGRRKMNIRANYARLTHKAFISN